MTATHRLRAAYLLPFLVAVAGANCSSEESDGSGAAAAGGTGGATSACDPAACPGEDTDCEVRACSASGECVRAPVAAGTQCTDPDDPDALLCDGEGACVGCDRKADCVAGQYCSVDGACVDEVDQGDACEAGAVCSGCAVGEMCPSDVCVDGVCCSTACGGECEACVAASTGGEDGTCAPSIVGTDPDGECDDGLFCTGVDSCDGNGACAGSGNPCPGHDQGPSCDDSCDDDVDACSAPDAAATSCDDGFGCTPTDTCDGAGVCVGTTTCGDGAYCAAGEACEDNNTDACGTCNADCTQAQAGGDCPLGVGCSSGADCASGNCQAGVCST